MKAIGGDASSKSGVALVARLEGKTLPDGQTLKLELDYRV